VIPAPPRKSSVRWRPELVSSHPLKSRLKRVLLPAPAPRRLPFGPARGLRLAVDFSHQTRLYLGLYELELNRHLRRLARPGARSFDVGGQIGYDALVLVNLSRAPVVSFEADAHTFQALGGNIALNPDLAPLVRTVNAYVDSVGEAPGCVTLDAVAFGQGGFVPDLIKIDVDGGEIEVLRGAARILASRRPHLIVETHSPELEDECGRLLAEVGYRPRIVHQRRWLADFRPVEHNRWLVAEGGPASTTAVSPR
jgi:methyltransferase FkbM-like protein